MITGNSCTLDLGLFHQLSDSHLSDHSIDVWGFSFFMHFDRSRRQLQICAPMRMSRWSWSGNRWLGMTNLLQWSTRICWFILVHFRQIISNDCSICLQSFSIFVVFSSAMCFCSLHIRASIIVCITDPRISRVCRRARVRALYINAFLHMQQEGIHRYEAWLHISLLRLGIGPLHLIKDSYSTWQSARLRTQTLEKKDSAVACNLTFWSKSHRFQDGNTINDMILYTQ